MKRIFALLVVLSFCLTGCVAMDATKDGVSSSYNGVKTVSGDIVGAAVKGVSAIASGGSVKISIETDANYNNEDVKEELLK